MNRKRLSSVTAVGVLLSAASAFAGVSRGPYLQSVDQDSATVGLRLDSACPAQIRYGEGDALTGTASSAGSSAQHFIQLGGLKPATAYNFTVEACGAPTGESGSFRTAPGPNARKVRFAAMGDMGTGGSAQRAVGQALAQARPEFWLTLGDNAYPSGTDEEFGAHFFEPLRDLLRISPVFPSPGNHEYETNDAQPYLDLFELPRNNADNSERYYSFDWGPVHGVSLDSNCAIGLGGDCSLEEQKTWLAADLAASKAPWKLVFFHHPPYSTGDHESTTQMREFGPIFEQYGVDLVLTGHDHNYERTRPLLNNQVVAEGTPGAVTYLVVGTGGAGTRAWATGEAEWTAFRDNVENGYLDVEIDGGKLAARFVNPEGKVVDEFTLQKDVPAAPELSIAVEPSSGAAPHQTRFVASGHDGAQVTWSFGDGQTAIAAGAEVTHTYEKPGVYTATATIRDILGETHSATTTVTVLDAQGQPGPVVEPPPAAEPPAAGTKASGGKSGCSAAGAGLVGIPVALLLVGALRRRRRA